MSCHPPPPTPHTTLECTDLPTLSLPIHHPHPAPSPARASPSRRPTPAPAYRTPHLSQHVCVCALHWQVDAGRYARPPQPGPRLLPPRLLPRGTSAQFESIGTYARLDGSRWGQVAHGIRWARPQVAHALEDGPLAREDLPPGLGTLPPKLGALACQAARLARSPRACCPRPRLEDG